MAPFPASSPRHQRDYDTPAARNVIVSDFIYTLTLLATKHQTNETTNATISTKGNHWSSGPMRQITIEYGNFLNGSFNWHEQVELKFCFKLKTLWKIMREQGARKRKFEIRRGRGYSFLLDRFETSWAAHTKGKERRKGGRNVSWLNSWLLLDSVSSLDWHILFYFSFV